MGIRHVVPFLQAGVLVLAACREDPTMGQTEPPVVRNVQLDTFAETMVDEPPIRVLSPSLKYPELLHQGGIEGRVLLAATVGVDGAVEEGSIEFLYASRLEFVAPATAVLAETSFRPAMHAGEPVRVRIEVPFAFRPAQDAQ